MLFFTAAKPMLWPSSFVGKIIFHSETGFYMFFACCVSETLECLWSTMTFPVTCLFHKNVRFDFGGCVSSSCLFRRQRQGRSQEDRPQPHHLGRQHPRRDHVPGPSQDYWQSCCSSGETLVDRVRSSKIGSSLVAVVAVVIAERSQHAVAVAANFIRHGEVTHQDAIRVSVMQRDARN